MRHRRFSRARPRVDFTATIAVLSLRPPCPLNNPQHRRLISDCFFHQRQFASFLVVAPVSNHSPSRHLGLSSLWREAIQVEMKNGLEASTQV